MAPDIEIIDSRYRDFRFSLPDVIADNTSAAGYVLGPWTRLDRVEVGNLGVALEVDGRSVEIGTTSAILGHPLRSMDAAARHARRYGCALQPGWIVLVGAATAAVALRPGCHIRATVARLGHVELRTADSTAAGGEGGTGKGNGRAD